MDDSAAAVDEAAMDPSMADATMDVAMMEDVPEMPAEESAAPPVALSGEAKMGVKRVDDSLSTDPDGDNLQTVTEYEVKFTSSGVTDGGLKFGASISIDETPGVNPASVHIGAASGSWTLTFGDNDPGIDLVGNIGLADADAISGGTMIIDPLNYTVGTGTSAVVRAVKLPGMSSALMLSGALTVVSDNSVQSTVVPITSVTGTVVGYFASSGTDESPAVSSGMPISLPRGTGLSATQVTGTTANASFVLSIGDLTATPGRTAVRLDGKLGSFTFALTSGDSGDNAWSLGTKYKAGSVSVGLGIDSNDVLAAGVEGKFAGNTISGTYVRQSGDDYNSIAFGGTATAPTVYAEPTSANEWTAIGVKFTRDLGSGTSIALAYSKKDDKSKGVSIPADSNQIELDFEYGLGGGATFYAGIERLSQDQAAWSLESGNIGRVKVTKKTTTLETGIKMAF